MEPDFTNFDWNSLNFCYDDIRDNQLEEIAIESNDTIIFNDELATDYFKFMDKLAPKYRGCQYKCMNDAIQLFKKEVFEYRETKRIKLTQTEHIIQLILSEPKKLFATNFRILCNENELENIQKIILMDRGSILNEYVFRHENLIDGFFNDTIEYIPLVVENNNLFEHSKYTFTNVKMNGYQLKISKTHQNVMLRLGHSVKIDIQNTEDVYFEYDIYEAISNNDYRIISQFQFHGEEQVFFNGTANYCSYNLPFNHISYALMVNVYDNNNKYCLKDIIDNIVIKFDNNEYIISNELLSLFNQKYKNNAIPLCKNLNLQISLVDSINLSRVDTIKIVLYFKDEYLFLGNIKNTTLVDFVCLSSNILRHGDPSYYSCSNGLAFSN